MVGQHQLEPFPPLDQADKHGLLAMGGDLSPERLRMAYSSGVFPWYEDGQPILWWSPNPRCVLYPKNLKIARSLQKSIRSHGYSFSFDQNFSAVIDYCAMPRSAQGGTWITSKMRSAYIHLHELGVAHSVETWCAGELVGGLYGLALGRVFFGESMFSTQTDGSKAALKFLCEYLKTNHYEMIDCQVSSAHLRSLGAVEIGRDQFIKTMNAALKVSVPEVKWG